jgi:hypothetical protein
MEKPYDDGYYGYENDPEYYQYNQTEYGMGETFYPNLLILFCISYTIATACKICSNYNNDNDNDNNNDNDNDNEQTLLPDTSQIKKEIIKFTEEMNDKECSICLEEFKKDEELTEIECNHYFHSECINDWFKSNGTCPLCRLGLV